MDSEAPIEGCFQNEVRSSLGSVGSQNVGNLSTFADSTGHISFGEHSIRTPVRFFIGLSAPPTSSMRSRMPPSTGTRNQRHFAARFRREVNDAYSRTNRIQC